jgi:hypothetical protein
MVAIGAAWQIEGFLKFFGSRLTLVRVVVNGGQLS